ncbi:tetratricopeptide repeat (TPR)-containing protein [Actinidia rufa]|uniref:Tetratricopeptide repeat (TPR)-containing protein n=1 Tax=Actinidia rufa TaxID=165716 RepID=A0A7J0H686_9ERIC|nr:tetratricopeptide repeat (TPR)-containing protein [Actinidia rufa]
MEDSSERKSGCGLLSAVFGRRNIWPRRSTSTGSQPTSNVANVVRTPSTPNSKRRRGGSDEAGFLDSSEPTSQKQADRVIARPGPSHPKGTTGISGELESMISDHQRSKGASSLVRASSGNVMLYPNSVMGNVVKKHNNEEAEKPTSLCRALSTRMDPEQLKIMGNEDYKNGRFAEALSLYDAAISIDPNKASYRSNKSAALTALGRLLEAVF